MKYKYVIFFLSICALLFGVVFLFLRSNTSQSSSDQSLALIKQKGTLVIASDIEYEPMEFYDESGNAVGFDLDVGREVAKRLGVKAEIRHYSWDDFFKVVTSGEADIGIASVTILPDRTKEMLFTHPYFKTGQVLVIRRNDSRIHMPEDLQGKLIGVQSNTTGKIIAQQFADANSLTEYASLETPKENSNSGFIYDLRVGNIDVFVTDFVGAVGIVKNNPEFKIAAEPFTQENYGIITKLGNRSLVEAINKILAEMKKDGTLEQFHDTWIKTDIGK